MADPRHEEVDHDFSYHVPPTEVGEIMDRVRGLIINCLHDITDLIPDGRDYRMGYSHMEEAQRCFIAALAKPKTRE